MAGIVTHRYTLIFAAFLLGLAAISANDALNTAMPWLVYAGVGLPIAAGFVWLASFAVIRYQMTWTRVTELVSTRKMAELDIAREELRIEANRTLAAAAIDQVRLGLIYPTDLIAGRLSNLPATARVEQVAPMLEAPSNDIHFEAIARKALGSRGAGRFIAFGGMGSGKTTLAKHIVNYAIQEIAESRAGQVYVIDPHAPKIVWGDGLKVIGAGMDYEAIADFLDYTVADIKARYKAGCGDDSRSLPAPYKPNFIVCEEWAGVIAELQATKRWTPVHNRTFYQDARKAGIGFFLVAHEYTVNALGLQGVSNLLNGVEYFITLEKDAITDEYRATLGNGFRDKNAYNLITPGPFQGRMYYSSTQVESERQKTDKYLIGPPDTYTIDLSNFKAEPDEFERSILDAIDRATSYNELHQIIKPGASNVSGPQIEKYKKILQKFDKRPYF
jgi:hypothetical protein